MITDASKKIVDASKKIEFILEWYNKERIKFSFAKQILLVKTWISICTKNEEYEMAAALNKEREKVVLAHLKNKRNNRTWKQRVSYFLIKIKRRISK